MVGRIARDELGWKIIVEENLGYGYLLVMPIRIFEEEFITSLGCKEGDEIEFNPLMDTLSYINSTLQDESITQVKYDVYE